MASVRPCPVPAQSLLARYSRDGAFTDCYCAQVDRAVSHAEYVEAFYTGTVFKVERRLLAWFASKPSTDLQARDLAQGTSDAFSAWTVEGRADDQILMCDVAGRTRSWLMVAPAPSGGRPCTQLYFGSAVVPSRRGTSGEPKMGALFRLLLGFHTVYSRVLLDAARSRLARR
jgi:hypothetical protein